MGVYLQPMPVHTSLQHSRNHSAHNLISRQSKYTAKHSQPVFVRVFVHHTLMSGDESAFTIRSAGGKSRASLTCVVVCTHADGDPEATPAGAKDGREAEGGGPEESSGSADTCTLADACQLIFVVCLVLICVCVCLCLSRGSKLSLLLNSFSVKSARVTSLLTSISQMKTQGVSKTLRSKKELRQQERDLLGQGIMPETLKDWKVCASFSFFLLFYILYIQAPS